MDTAILDSPLLRGEYIPFDYEDEDEDILSDKTNSNDLVGLAAISNINSPGQDDVYQRSGLSRLIWMTMRQPMSGPPEKELWMSGQTMQCFTVLDGCMAIVTGPCQPTTTSLGTHITY